MANLFKPKMPKVQAQPVIPQKDDKAIQEENAQAAAKQMNLGANVMTNRTPGTTGGGARLGDYGSPAQTTSPTVLRG